MNLPDFLTFLAHVFLQGPYMIFPSIANVLGKILCNLTGFGKNLT